MSEKRDLFFLSRYGSQAERDACELILRTRAKKSLAVRLEFEPPVLEALKAAARDDDVTVNEWVADAVEAALRTWTTRIRF